MPEIDLRDPLYRRVTLPSGRVRYYPCADRQVLDALPEGDFLLRVRNAGKTCVRVDGLDPDTARVSAALLAFKEDLRTALAQAARSRPGPAHRVATELELRGHAAYRAIVGDEPIIWTTPSLADVVNTAVDAWFAQHADQCAPTTP